MNRPDFSGRQFPLLPQRIYFGELKTPQKNQNQCLHQLIDGLLLLESLSEVSQVQRGDGMGDEEVDEKEKVAQ